MYYVLRINILPFVVVVVNCLEVLQAEPTRGRHHPHLHIVSGEWCIVSGIWCMVYRCVVYSHHRLHRLVDIDRFRVEKVTTASQSKSNIVWI
jgi:hypothetical protein